MRKQGLSASGALASDPPPPAQAQLTNRRSNIDLNIPSHFGQQANPIRQQQQQQPHVNLPNGTASPQLVNGVPPSNGNGTGGSAHEDPVANYTLQGVMQWLNSEYRRYERDRNAWEIERASLVVR
jgi:Striatin family